MSDLMVPLSSVQAAADRASFTSGHNPVRITQRRLDVLVGGVEGRLTWGRRGSALIHSFRLYAPGEEFEYEIVTQFARPLVRAGLIYCWSGIGTYGQRGGCDVHQILVRALA